MATTNELCKYCVIKCRKPQLEAEKAALHTIYQSNPSTANQEAVIEKQREIKLLIGVCKQTRSQSA